MSSLLSAPATPAVRKPAFELAFGSGSADDWALALAEVSVEAGLAPAVDAASVVLAARDDAPSAALTDTGHVSLGFADDATVGVFKGAVCAVGRTVSGKTRVVASNGGAALAAFRLDQGYEQQSAGDVVRDLAGKAAVDTGSVDDGPSLPYYVVDSLHSAWEHVAKLAALSGFEAWLDADNALHFGPFQAGSPVQTFTYGQDVLELDALEAPPAAGSVTVVGEGSAGSNGSDAWSWNLKDASPLKGTAGSGDPALVLQLGALRSADAASAAAQGIVAKAKLGGLTARLLVPGAPKAAVGSTVAIAGAPDDTLNGSWLVRCTRHRLVKARGYTTLLLLAKGDT
ncbi:MAG: contractile injection system protein, VgrG/Pvc8 family [Gaiellaceae bacterium]